MKRRIQLGFDSKRIKRQQKLRLGRRNIRSPRAQIHRGHFYGKKWYPEQALRTFKS